MLPENSSLIHFSFSDAHEIVNSVEQYPVSFDDLWQWVGYSNKANALRVVHKEMAETLDYIQIIRKDEDAASVSGYRNTTEYWLTVDAAKSLAMMAKTKKGKEVRKYFIECEKIARKAVKANQEIEASETQWKARALEAEERLYNKREAIINLHNPTNASLILGAKIVEIPKNIDRTVMCNASGQPIATFDGVSITELAARYGFGKGTKANNQCRIWLASIGITANSWVREMSAIAVDRLPRDIIAQLDSAFATRNGDRQLLLGE